MDTLESCSSPSIPMEGVVTSDIENLALPISTKTDDRVHVIVRKDYHVDVDNDNDDGDVDRIAVDNEDDDNNDDGAGDVDDYDEDDGLEEADEEEEEQREQDEQYEQEQKYKVESELMCCEPSSSATGRNTSSCSVNSVNYKQHASSSFTVSKPITVDVQWPPNTQPLTSQQDEKKAHLNRLKNLRKHIEYIEQTNWLYKPIEELIGHIDSTNKKV